MSNLVVNLMAPPWWLAISLAAALALVCRAARWLTTSGAVSTFIVGAIVFGLGGGWFAVPLLTFFVSSSLLSKIGKARKQAANSVIEKDSTRDAGQVWANGGLATLLVLIYFWAVHHWSMLTTRSILMLYLAALATVNADTWATEIGSLSPRLPISLWNGKPAPPGTSGAISLLGTIGALFGAFVVPLSVFWGWGLIRQPGELAAVVSAGFLGSLADSLLGASLQIQYRDPQTNELTERQFVANRRAVRVRGFAPITNDVVNFLASLCGVGIAWLLLHYAAYR